VTTDLNRVKFLKRMSEADPAKVLGGTAARLFTFGAEGSECGVRWLDTALDCFPKHPGRCPTTALHNAD
jgi:hypothetical protein